MRSRIVLTAVLAAASIAGSAVPGHAARTETVTYVGGTGLVRSCPAAGIGINGGCFTVQPGETRLDFRVDDTVASNLAFAVQFSRITVPGGIEYVTYRGCGSLTGIPVSGLSSDISVFVGDVNEVVFRALSDAVGAPYPPPACAGDRAGTTGTITMTAA